MTDTPTSDFVFNHTMLRVKDAKRSLDFYTRVLGFSAIVREARFAQANFSLYFLILDPAGGGPGAEQIWPSCGSWLGEAEEACWNSRTITVRRTTPPSPITTATASRADSATSASPRPTSMRRLRPVSRTWACRSRSG